MKISKEIKAGLIALIAIVSFVLLYQFMKGKSLFTTDDTYFAKFDNVDGLEQSNPVSINGLKVGQVDKILPQTAKDGTIYFVVKVLVDKGFSFSKKVRSWQSSSAIQLTELPFFKIPKFPISKGCSMYINF